MLMETITLLESAASRGNLERMIELIKSDNNIDIMNALRSATKHGHLHVVKYFVNPDNISHGDDVLETAVRYGHINIIHYVVELGIKIDDTTALSIAAGNGDILIVKYLVSLGANVNIDIQIDEHMPFITVERHTPLVIAIQCLHIETVKYLLDAGANPSLLDNGMSPLCWALKCHQISIIKLLVDAGCSVNYINDEGMTLLHKIFYYQMDTDTRRFVIAGKYKNRNVNFIDEKERIMKDEIMEIVEYLLMLGVDKNIVDSSGFKAHDYAIEKGFDEIVKYIELFEPDMTKGVQL